MKKTTLVFLLLSNTTVWCQKTPHNMNGNSVECRETFGGPIKATISWSEISADRIPTIDLIASSCKTVTTFTNSYAYGGMTFENGDSHMNLSDRPCADELRSLVESYGNDDSGNPSRQTRLVNQACSHKLGYIEVDPGACEAGGPPPICKVPHWKPDPNAWAKWKQLQKQLLNSRIERCVQIVENCQVEIGKPNTQQQKPTHTELAYNTTDDETDPYSKPTNRGDASLDADVDRLSGQIERNAKSKSREISQATSNTRKWADNNLAIAEQQLAADNAARNARNSNGGGNGNGGGGGCPGDKEFYRQLEIETKNCGGLGGDECRIKCQIKGFDWWLANCKKYATQDEINLVINKKNATIAQWNASKTQNFKAR